ncbi:hypothetical protein J1605_013632 [Eschrichtius robustus]|uniref:Uncharacterized protein n=1 Tax=Eschrichtius robustus TaxID=9764 RepID=A0AB34GHW3_ESCRO|nr:hypothetical protein J1605_013632 [Eschrichtius robustus]
METWIFQAKEEEIAQIYETSRIVRQAVTVLGLKTPPVPMRDSKEPGADSNLPKRPAYDQVKPGNRHARGLAHGDGADTQKWAALEAGIPPDQG